MNYELFRNEISNMSCKKDKRNRTIAIVSSALCVIFIITIIILAVSKKSGGPSSIVRDSSEQSKSSSEAPPRLCTSEECILSASDILLSMNTSVDPCDDFYRFTCDRWGSRHPNNKHFSQTTAFATVEEKLCMQSIKLFNKNASMEEPKPVWQARDMYRSCVDEDTRNNKGYTPILKYLSQLGLPEIPRFFNLSKTAAENSSNYKFDWIKTDAAMNKLLDLSLFVECKVTKNMFNTSQNAIVFSVPKDRVFGFQSLAMSDEQHDKFIEIENLVEGDHDPESDKLREARKDFMLFAFIQLIFENHNLTINDKEKLLNATLAIEEVDMLFKKIKIRANNVKFGPLSNISVNELQEDTDKLLKKFNAQPENLWKRYLEQLFEGTNVSLDLSNEDKILISPHHKAYYAEVATFIALELETKIELWAWWKAVKNLIIHTTSDAKAHLQLFMETIGLDLKISKQISCASLTKRSMDYAVTHALVDKTFLNTTKPKVEELWYNIKKAFEMRVDNLNWMDYSTKLITIEKSRAMKDKIGFPEWLLDKDQLENFYSTLTINPDTYLDNLVEIVKFKRKHNLERLHELNDNYWTDSPMKVNAYNNIFGNEINIPVAIINYPFYNEALEVLNYGTLGTVLGHELTHGFDNTGRQFDKFGNYANWWNHPTQIKFFTKAICFVHQYNAFYVPEAKAFVNGTISLGENIADNGGIHHAYLAYQNQKEYRGRGEELKLPGLENYTNDQLFFISYANLWCDEESLHTLNTQLKSVHAPNKYRVLGNLRNSEEFAEAFNCPVGSNMNPLKKCQIW